VTTDAHEGYSADWKHARGAGTQILFPIYENVCKFVGGLSSVNILEMIDFIDFVLEGPGATPVL
jgi:hypothetical protein